MKDAATLLADAVGERSPGQREAFLSEVLKYAAAGLVIMRGAEKAAEAVYQLGDAVVTRSNKV